LKNGVFCALNSLGPLTEFEIGVIFLSLRIAFWATLVALPIALGVAWVLTRRNFRGKTILSAFVFLPLVLPPVVVGYVLLIIFSPTGAFGSVLSGLGINPSFTWQGAALAAGTMAFPLMVRAFQQGFAAIDPGLTEAASTLGASPAFAFRTIVLPLLAPATLSAGILGFSRALGEFGATITFVAAIPGVSLTLPSAIYTSLQVPGQEGSSLRLVVIAVLLAVGAIMASEFIARRAQRLREAS